MKRVYVEENWCLACHLCEYWCALSNSPLDNMVKLKNKDIRPRIQVEEGKDINFAVSCRHCTDPICVKSCISGALTINDGLIQIDQTKCVGCYTCIMACPYGALMPNEEGVMQKCELCTSNGTEPSCVQHCPNNAIKYEER
jgi:carbon-monoxide dehydrogenase iron sulfur subunit